MKLCADTIPKHTDRSARSNLWSHPGQAGGLPHLFKLVVKPIDTKVLEVKEVDGQRVVLSKIFGVAIFTNGKIAVKDYISSSNTNKGNGPFFGYSTYTFEDGSSITARYAGTLSAGQPVRGEYTILSGTGVYAGATGTGNFQSTPSKFPEASLYTGKLDITTP